MAHYKFKLNLDIPKEYPARAPEVVGTCHDSDGLYNCNCILSRLREHQGPESCEFFGRPIEPLAFYLPPYSEVQQQKQSPLYGVLPKEVRNMIFEFALADDNAIATDHDNISRWQVGSDADVPRPDIAHALLQTCKAIYLEAYCLPMQLNGYQSYSCYGRQRPDPNRITPWQYALIQRLDISLSQGEIEVGYLEDELADWESTTRHSGAYVVPRFYCPRQPDRRPVSVVRAHGFGLLKQSEVLRSRMNDGDEVTLPQGTEDWRYPEGYPRSFTARAMAARAITHLTLRIARTEWSTWTYDPSATTNEQQLALDPACGSGQIDPTRVSDMLELAEARRSGRHPEYTSTWGGAIVLLPDLKTFELILETFSVKKHQLNTVVKCARTWKFPLRDTQYELVHDGSVESLNWKNAADAEGDHKDDSELGRAQKDLHKPEATENADQSSSSDRSADEGITYQPTGSLDEDRRSLSSDDPPVYDRDALRIDWLERYNDEAWMHNAHEFEVRIMRFRRIKAD